MQKIVINSKHGGFGLSHKAMIRLAELKGIELFAYMNPRDKNGSIDFDKYVLFDPDKYTKKDYFVLHYVTIKKDNISKKELNDNYYSKSPQRDDPDLIKVIEELGDEADGTSANLKIVEIPDGVKWVIDEYDGWESVEEEHRSWG